MAGSLQSLLCVFRYKNVPFKWLRVGDVLTGPSTPRQVSTNCHELKQAVKNPPIKFDPPHVTSAVLEGGLTKYYCNRNPRSLELLGVAEKPKGFQTKNQRVDYYHRLLVEVSSRHFSAFVNHNNGNKVVEASTKEFCVSRYLYKTSDTSAAYNIGRVIAHRCRNSGLSRVMWEHKWDRDHAKVKAFVRGLKKEGLILNEPKPRKTLPPAGTLPR